MYKENFPERIKKARIDAGYTQREIAETVKIQQSKIAKLESGNQEPDLETLGKLAEFYAVSIDWLLGIGQKELAQTTPPPKPKANIIDRAISGISLISFLATLSSEERNTFLSGKMKFNQFTDSEYFRALSPEQQIYMYQEYQMQQWIKEQEETAKPLTNAQ